MFYPVEFLIMISFKEKGFTLINLQQIWMNFNTFPSSSGVDCAIQINFNLDSVDKRWKFLCCERYQSE